MTAFVGMKCRTSRSSRTRAPTSVSSIVADTRSAEADIQVRQAEDLPATGLRGDNDDTAAGRGVQRLDPAAVLDVCALGGRHDRGLGQPHRVANNRTWVARPRGGEYGTHLDGEHSVGAKLE